VWGGVEDSEYTELEEAALAAINAALATGPVPFETLADVCRHEIVAAADETGVHPEDMLADLLEAPGLWTTDNDMVGRLDLVLDGVVFTHRLTEDEAAAGAVDLLPDLTVLDFDAPATGPHLHLGGGGEFRLEFPDTEHGLPRFNGPQGWLDAYRPGDLLSFTRTGTTISVARLDLQGAGEVEAEALQGAVLAGMPEPNIGTDLTTLLVDLLIDDPTLFRTPVRPIGDLAVATGIDIQGEYAGTLDTPWEPPGVVMMRERRARIHVDFGFGDCCEEAFDAVLESWRDFVIEDRPPPSTVDSALGHSDVAFAFVEWITDNVGPGSDTLDRFLTALIDNGAREAPVFFVRGVNRQRLGRYVEAEPDFERAMSRDPEWVGARLAVAAYQEIRGDGLRAIGLRRRAGEHEGDSVDLAFLAEMFERHRGASRNDPCPCGSGRKFKVCCSVNPQLTPTDRIRWLTRKLYRFTVSPRHLMSLHYLADVAASVDERNSNPDEFMDYPFLLDVAAFESCLLSFAEEQGPLLPQDERDLVDAWLLSARRLWEVDSVTPGRLVLRDTQTGDTVDVAEEAGSMFARVGDLLLARVADGFGADRLIGEIVPVDLRHREATLELVDLGPTDTDFASWFGWISAPPRMKTTDGEDMVLCSVAVRPHNWNRITALLDDLYERHNDDEWVWAGVNHEGNKVIRARIQREGDQLTVETLSEPRLEKVLEAIGEVEVVSDARTPVTSPEDMKAIAGDVPTPAPAPELETLLAHKVAEMEEEWIDTPIPALGGSTPREAAVDPTRREDLIALLRSFDGMRTPGTFDPDRLRFLLGIEE